MSFYYPLGLLGLIGIPIIILIYIIKSKYTEQTVASTYLWNLSEKFLKKKKPVLTVFIISVAIAGPVFTVKNAASDVYVVLDGSASMNTVCDGETETRFELAQKRINGLIDEQKEGSSYSLVLVSDTVDTVFEGLKSKEQAKIFNVDRPVEQ